MRRNQETRCDEISPCKGSNGRELQSSSERLRPDSGPLHGRVDVEGRTDYRRSPFERDVSLNGSSEWGSDTVRRLHSLASEELLIGRSGWYSDVCGELEALLSLLSGQRWNERLHTAAACCDSNRRSEVQWLDAQCSKLISQLCDVVYLLRRLGVSPELSEPWLRHRIRHFLSAKAAIEQAFVTLVSDFTSKQARNEA